MTASKAEVGVTAASALFDAGMTVCPDADSTKASPKQNRSDLARLTAIGDAQTADAQHNRSPVSIGPTRILQSAEGRKCGQSARGATPFKLDRLDELNLLRQSAYRTVTAP